jgi:hypothetical protein
MSAQPSNRTGEAAGRPKTRLFVVVAVLLVATVLALTLASVAGAQSGGGYDVTWSTVDGGGGRSTGGAYTLEGTVGQADAGTQSGAGYALGGGFWAEAAEVIAAFYHLFLPSALR